MSENEPKSILISKRQQSIGLLAFYFEKIEFLTLSETQFPTEDLVQLSLFARYSIHPIYKSGKIYSIYLKLAEYYWKYVLGQRKEIAQKNLQDEERNQINEQNQQVCQQNQNQSQVETRTEEKLQKNQNLVEQNEVKQTEAIQQDEKIQKMVSKNYEQIKSLVISLKPLNLDFSQNLDKKIQILKSWNVVPHKLQNFTPKKQPQPLTMNKITSKTYLEELKIPKNTNKDSTIILGKNQSTQTKQMKYTLKVQSRKNFVDQKKKQQENSSLLDKKSIELTYLLNIITKEFFEDFSNDIEKLIEQNLDIIPIFCDKILQKVKDEHNFIEIYVRLMKKLCKCKRVSNSTASSALQKKFVQFLQQKFIELISENVNYSQQSQQSYVYQKQIIGMCTFIGKLIRDNLISLKIFKVCFWQIVYRYVSKVKQNPQNYVTNECLIAGVVLISDSMQQKQLKKIIQKQKQSKITEEISEDAFEKMINALVDPNDEDSSCREQLYDKLIDSISIQEYPGILNGLIQIFQSKRLKLKFLVEGWYAKLKNIDKTQQSSINKNQKEKEQIVDNKSQQKEQEKFYVNLMRQIKDLQCDLSLKDVHVIKLLEPLRRLIHEQAKGMKNIQKFLIEFLNQFANTSKKSTMFKRIEFLFEFLASIQSNMVIKVKSKCIQLITENLFENLMIIECDFPFLVEGLCKIMVYFRKDLGLSADEVLEKVKLAEDDPDLEDFYHKIEKNFIHVVRGQQD